MRDKIIEMIKHYDQIDWNISCVGPSKYLEVLADQIIALFKEAELKWYNAGWEDAMNKTPLDKLKTVHVSKDNMGRFK